MSVQVLSPGVKPLRVARSRSEVGKSWQPYWDGLRRAVLFMEGGGVKAHDLSPNRRIFDLQSGVSWNRSRFGRVADFDGTANAYADLSETVLYQPPFTVFTLFLVRDHNGKTLWSNAESGDTNTFHHLVVQFDSGSTPNVLIANTWADGSDDFADSGAAGTTVVTENEWHTGAGVWATTTDRRVYLDGIFEGQNTTTQDAGTRPDSEDIGRLGDSTPSQQVDGLISLTYTWTRALNDTQISRLHIDPFGPFRPARRVSVIVPAAAGFTMQADSGVYSITGSDAIGKIATPTDSGVYSVSGSDMNPNITEPVESGTYSVTGSDAIGNIKTPTDSGTYSITGSDVGFTITLQTDSGVYSLTGSPANLLRSLLINAEPGVYSITGSAADLLRSFILPAESGTYSIAGSDMIGAISLPADSGVYVLTGADADLIRSFLLLAESGSYSITGTDANLTLQALLTAESGTYSIAGAEINIGITMPVEPGTYNLVGVNADLTAQFQLLAESGTYSLNGVSISPNITFPAEGGSYTLLGSDALLLAARKILAESGIYTLSGSAADLLVTSAIVPDQPGLEYSIGDARVHYDVDTGLVKIHYTIGPNRLHYDTED